MLTSKAVALIKYITLVLCISVVLTSIGNIINIITKDKYKETIINIFNFPFGVIYILTYVLVGIACVVMPLMLIFVISCSIIILFISFTNIIKLQNNLPIIFISALVSCCSISYFGEKLIKLFPMFSDNKREKVILAGKIALKILNPRKLIYIVTILFYIISNIERLNGSQIVAWEWWGNLSQVIDALLISFIAIDTFLLTFTKKLENK